jgi:lipoprotein NlpD
MIARLFFLFLLILLVSCGQQTLLAPVTELTDYSHPTPLKHVVCAKETLYAIAFRYNKDFYTIAALNHLTYPYTICVGQVLLINPKPERRHRITTRMTTSFVGKKLRKKAVTVKSSTANRQAIIANYTFNWPTEGRVVANFIPANGKKGIDIAGRKGALIKAAAKGVVAYAGSGLAGYGNLIIIKHEGPFLTAYGNNLRNLVSEGQQVKAGQIIAEMGVVDRTFWGVHFEIRKAGHPVNPSRYLPRH